MWSTKTINIEADEPDYDFHSDVIAVENEATSDIVLYMLPSTCIELSQVEEISLILREYIRALRW